MSGETGKDRVQLLHMKKKEARRPAFTALHNILCPGSKLNAFYSALEIETGVPAERWGHVRQGMATCSETERDKLKELIERLLVKFADDRISVRTLQSIDLQYFVRLSNSQYEAWSKEASQNGDTGTKLAVVPSVQRKEDHLPSPAADSGRKLVIQNGEPEDAVGLIFKPGTRIVIDANPDGTTSVTIGKKS